MIDYLDQKSTRRIIWETLIGGKICSSGMFGLSRLTNHDVHGPYSHSLSLSSHSPPTTFSCITITIRKWSCQEKKRWHGYGYLFSALFRLRLLHNNARISCGPCLYPHSAFDPTEEKPTLARFVSFLSQASLVLVGPGMFGYRHCIPDMNRPVLGFFSASNQTNNDASGRCCRHTKTFWLLFHLDILLFWHSWVLSCFSLFLFLVSSADTRGFGVFGTKMEAHEWSLYWLILFLLFLVFFPPQITLSTFCNDVRYACISMYSYCWYIDEWLDGRTSYIPRGRTMFY